MALTLLAAIAANLAPAEQALKVVATTPSAFPPSFEENPFTYAFALFSMSMMSMVSFAQLLNAWQSARKERDLIRHPGCYIEVFKLPPWSALSLYRRMMASLYAAFFICTFPDVLVLLLWGEAENATMVDLFTLDRIGDGLALIPFAMSVGIGVMLSQVIPQKLITSARGDLGNEVRKPNWRTLLPTLKIAGLLLFLAAGVTLGKAGWG